MQLLLFSEKSNRIITLCRTNVIEKGNLKMHRFIITGNFYFKLEILA